jgi:hypothetical protein
MSYRATVLTHIFKELASLGSPGVYLQYSELIRSASLSVLTFPLHCSVRERNLIVWLFDVPHMYFLNTGVMHYVSTRTSRQPVAGGECTHIKTPSVQSLT